MTEETFKSIYRDHTACPESRFDDLRILASYRMVTGGTMLALFLMGGYRIFFFDAYNCNYESLNPIGGYRTDQNITLLVGRIAEMIGATLEGQPS